MPETDLAALPILPADEFLRTWQASPRDAFLPLIWADYLEERGEPAGDLLRTLIVAHRRIAKAEPPASWDDAIESLPAEWRSVFAIGCAARCILWMPSNYITEQEEDTMELIYDMTISPWSAAAGSRSAAAGSRAAAAGSRAAAAWSRAAAAWSRTDAAGSRAAAAGSRAAAAWSRTAAAGSRADAAWSRADAAWSRTAAAGSRADAAWSRTAAAGSRAPGGGSREEKWQSHWLSAVRSVS